MIRLPFRHRIATTWRSTRFLARGSSMVAAGWRSDTAVENSVHNLSRREHVRRGSEECHR